MKRMRGGASVMPPSLVHVHAFAEPLQGIARIYEVISMNHTRYVARRRRQRLLVEPLEPRALLSAAAWDVPAAAPVATVEVAGARAGATGAIVLPRPSGPSPVGRTSLVVADASRADPFSPDSSARRELVVTLWYPSGHVRPGAPRAPYVADAAAYAPSVAKDLGGGSGQAPTTDEVQRMLESIRTHATAGTPLSRRARAFPVVLLLPGRGSSPEFYTAYAEDLASRGYVVAGVNPTGIADVTVFPDGHVATSRVPDIASIPADGLAEESAWETSLLAADGRSVLDQLTRMNTGAIPSFLRGRLDLSRVAAIGHSIGGAAAAELAATDPRVRTGADLDGTLWGRAQTSGVGKPFLFLTASDPTVAQLKQAGLTRREYQRIVDQAALDTAGVAATIRLGGYRLVFDGFHHSSFTDQELERPASGDRPSGALAVRVVEDYLTAFLGMTLYGRRSALYGARAHPPRGVWFSTPAAGTPRRDGTA